MSNKTSDENVVNDIKILNKFCEYEDAVVLTEDTLEEVQDALQNILAEREQDKKRIKELEADLYSANEIISDLIDNIPKQVVIDLIENETIDISGFECIAVEDLQELLGGEIHENRT